MEKAVVVDRFYQYGTEGFQVLGRIGSEFVVQWGLNEGDNWETISSGYSYEVFSDEQSARDEFEFRREYYSQV